MRKLSFSFDLEPKGFLRFSGIERVVEHINAGDLCLLPSDSAYVLTGLPSEPGLSSDLDIILRRAGLPMSLAFGSLRMASRWVVMSSMARRLVGELTPGGLTFVAQPGTAAKRGFAAARLNAPGTIGVRLTESRIETQLSYELEQPITTTPVRLSDGSLALTSDEALSVVSARMAELGSERRLGMLIGSVPCPGRLSTVVAEESVKGALSRLVIVRQGAISLDRLREVARDCQFDDVVLE